MVEKDSLRSGYRERVVKKNPHVYLPIVNIRQITLSLWGFPDRFLEWGACGWISLMDKHVSFSHLPGSCRPGRLSAGRGQELLSPGCGVGGLEGGRRSQGGLCPRV